MIDGDAHVHHTLTDAVDIPDNTFWMQDGADDTVDQTKGKHITEVIFSWLIIITFFC